MLNPDKIEKQSILNSLVDAKQYVKGKLLDIGCGNKPYLPLFFDVLDEYIGLDLPNSGSTNKPKNLADVYCSVLKLPFQSNSFDTVISTQVLEHVAEPKTMLLEAHRVLKGGGYLILTAPMTWGLHEIPYDYYRYTEYGLKYLAEKAGFKIVYIKERFGFWAMIGQRISSRIYFLWGKPKSLFSEFIKRSVCAAFQAIFLSIDLFIKAEGETLGYIMVANKFTYES